MAPPSTGSDRNSGGAASQSTVCRRDQPPLLEGASLRVEIMRCRQAAALANIAEPPVADLRWTSALLNGGLRARDRAGPLCARCALNCSYVVIKVLRREPERVTQLALFDTSAPPNTPERA